MDDELLGETYKTEAITIDDELVLVTTDEKGQVIKREYPDGDWIEIGYDEDGNKANSINSDGESVIRQFDENNRCIHETYGDGKWNKCKWDDNGNMLSFIDSNGCTQLAEYNDKNQCIKIVEGGETWEYEYDCLGNRNKGTKNNGEYWVCCEFKDSGIVYESDKLGNWGDSKNPSNLIHHYDNNGFDSTFIRENGVLIDSRFNTSYEKLPITIQEARIEYGFWTDDMIIKYDHLLNWLVISHLPELSDNIIEKYEDKLDMRMVNWLRRVWG